ncbi:MAG: hypothetical protein ACYS1C_06520, partial [Planctomycetota bacterium]
RTGWFGGRWAVRLLGQLDWLAVQHWKRRLCPQALSASDMRKARLARRLRGWCIPRRIVGALRDIFARAQ